MAHISVIVSTRSDIPVELIGQRVVLMRVETDRLTGCDDRRGGGDCEISVKSVG